ncbi:unnamed protein product [Schistosoma margrebowiei]|uniref:Uncharacterized protein n=1 Tax=Schistosoma margrebowiei TaxID=48269 RepID=A0A183L8C9_9TREM|nr:unnamed protein product [Schistosoma margrebowiei]
MKLKLKKHWTTGRTISQKFNAAFLRDTNKLNKFKIVLSNKFQTFHDLLNGERTTMENKWKEIKKASTSTCHEVLDHKNLHHKEWITVDTLDQIQKRRYNKAPINISRTRTEKFPMATEFIMDKELFINTCTSKSQLTDRLQYQMCYLLEIKLCYRQHIQTEKLFHHIIRLELNYLSSSGSVKHSASIATITWQ